MFSGFSRESGYRHYPVARRRPVLSGSTHRTDLPAQRLSTPFNGLFRQSADVSLLRPRFTLKHSNGILTVSSIGYALRLPLRSRLTLSIIVTYTYICFSMTSSTSRGVPSTANGMLPYQSHIKHDSTASVPDLCPIIIHAGSLD